MKDSIIEIMTEILKIEQDELAELVTPQKLCEATLRKADE